MENQCVEQLSFTYRTEDAARLPAVHSSPAHAGWNEGWPSILSSHSLGDG